MLDAGGECGGRCVWECVCVCVLASPRSFTPSSASTHPNRFVRDTQRLYFLFAAAVTSSDRRTLLAGTQRTVRRYSAGEARGLLLTSKTNFCFTLNCLF